MIKTSTFISRCGLAAIVGGILMMIETIFYAFTHGTTTEARHATLFGLTGRQHAMLLNPTTWLLLAFGLVGVYAITASRIGRSGRIGFSIALTGHLLAFASWILQVWVANPDTQFESLPVIGGFVLWVLSLLIVAIGMIWFGIAILTTGALPRWNLLPLLIGLLLPLLLWFQGIYIAETSDSSPLWTLLYIVAPIPLSLCWILLGQTLRAARPLETAPLHG
jgi:hypothetical protein